MARSSLDATVALIEKEAPGTKTATFTADVKDTDRAEEVVEAVAKQFGRLDVLVANAGTGNPMGKRTLLVYARARAILTCCSQ